MSASWNNDRPHYPKGFRASFLIIGGFLWEFLLALPALLSLRRFYREREKPGEPAVAIVCDNLDEVNGIALSSRVLVEKMREKGRQVFLVGVAFHGKPARREGQGGCVVLLPGRCSMDQPGNKGSETALPRLKPFLEFLRENPIDVFEFGTPSALPFTALVYARLLGIKTFSHYRTDLLSYTRILIASRLGAWAINTWVTLFTRLAGPVIVPSNFFRPLIARMGVHRRRVVKIPRGVDLARFSPEKAALGAWERLGLPREGLRLLYVGRVSREKNLPLLSDLFHDLIRILPSASLTVVGDGPYLEEMRNSLHATGRAFFTGVLEGEDLASVFAAADLFVFPSTTDTFGNSVIEALASGLPALVSDRGGPREIVEDGESGFVFKSGKEGLHGIPERLRELDADRGRLSRMKEKARERALLFTFDRSADAFWEYYRRYHAEGGSPAGPDREGEAP